MASSQVSRSARPCLSSPKAHGPAPPAARRGDFLLGIPQPEELLRRDAIEEAEFQICHRPVFASHLAETRARGHLLANDQVCASAPPARAGTIRRSCHEELDY